MNKNSRFDFYLDTLEKLKSNRSAIVLSETMKVILAVLCIILLAILAWKLYTLFTSKTEIEQAKASLNQIVDVAESLKPGASATYLVTGPFQKPKVYDKWWSIVYFIKNDAKPDSCVNKDCVCVCEIAPDYGLPIIGAFDGPTKIDQDLRRKSCNKMGVCRILNYGVELVGGSIDIKELLELKIWKSRTTGITFVEPKDELARFGLYFSYFFQKNAWEIAKRATAENKKEFCDAFTNYMNYWEFKIKAHIDVAVTARYSASGSKQEFSCDFNSYDSSKSADYSETHRLVPSAEESGTDLISVKVSVQK